MIQAAVQRQPSEGPGVGMTRGNVPAAWYPDPQRQHDHRYWDGSRWTDHVADRGLQGTDPPTGVFPPPLPPSPTPATAGEPPKRAAPITDETATSQPAPVDAVVAGGLRDMPNDYEPSSRRNRLAGAVVHYVGEHEHAAGARYGHLVTMQEAVEASVTVEVLLQQDASLAPHVMHEVTRIVMRASEDVLDPGSSFDRLATLLRANGVAVNNGLVSVDPDHEPGKLNPLAELYWTMQAIEIRGRKEANASDRSFFDSAFDGSEESSGVITTVMAWAAIAIGRSVASGHCRFQLPAWNRWVPELAGSGWHPSPFHVETPGQRPTFERFWNGKDWTARMRRFDGRRWEEAAYPLENPAVHGY